MRSPSGPTPAQCNFPHKYTITLLNKLVCSSNAIDTVTAARMARGDQINIFPELGPQNILLPRTQSVSCKVISFMNWILQMY